MSSLKNIIMDIDVEPLESFASLRPREAAQLQGEPSQNSPASQSPKLDVSEQSQSDIRRRRSNRVSKPSSQTSSSRPSLARRRSSGTAESMESYGHQLGSSQSSSGMGISRQSSRGSNPPEPHIRYTPVTGRVSRAKKGQPVHVCDQCDPPRVFTRAEHLRRHQLGHQKPAYPCTFEDCEKAFHRHDLLARHLHRHETQGEKAFKAGDDPRSRSSSMSSASQTPPFKKEPQLTLQTAMGSQMSPAGSATPRTSASTEGGMTATVFDPIMPGFNFAPQSSSDQSGSSSQFSRGGARTSGGGPPQANSGSWAGSTFTTDVPDHYITGINSAPYHCQDTTDQIFHSNKPTNGLPMLTLQVPDLTCPPALTSYATSPWGGYSSDGTWSTPSSEVDKCGGNFPRDRSSSVPTVPEWNSQPSWGSPQFGNATLQPPRNAGLDPVPEHYESPPYLDPRFSPPLPNYRLGGGASLTDGFNMELVGTPTPVTSLFRPYTQSFSASTSRAPKPEFPVFPRGQYQLVDSPHIGLSPNSMGVAPSIALVDDCVASYKTNLEPFYSIIHPHIYTLPQDELVRYAMAALGSQFLNLPEHRKIGILAHRTCTKMIMSQQCSEPNLSTMQAIFLTEVFARLRSNRLDVHPSLPFRKLCKKLVDCSREDMSSTYARLSVGEINAAIEIQLQQSSQKVPTSTREQIIENMWQHWIGWEVRQRLRTVCLAFDVFQSIYYDQERCQPKVTTESAFFAVPSEPLWNAASSQVWFNLIRASNCAAVRFCRLETLTCKSLVQLPLPTQFLALTSLVAALPAWNQQIQSLFGGFMQPYALLALHHTPLKKLLALTGESWVLGKKITSHSDFEAMKPSIRSWTVSPFGELAAWYACNFLRFCFAESYDAQRTFHTIGDYWAIYTCTLIVWAFGQRPPALPPGSGNTGAALSRRTSPATLSSSEGAAEVLSRALIWTETMASHPPEQLISLHIRMDTAAVVEAARARLMSERLINCQPPALLLDACSVLEKLREQSPRLF